MGFGETSIPDLSTVNEGFASTGSYSWSEIGENLKPVGSLLGAAAKYTGGYLTASSKATAAKSEASLMRSEASLMDYNALLAKEETSIATRERDIEIDQHRAEMGRILGQQATFYAWGNIDIGDPTGTPAQVRLRSLWNAEKDESIIIERGWVKKSTAEAKAKVYEFKAGQLRAVAPVVEAGGELSRAAGLLSLSGELLKDTGVLS